jgi:uncharacterized membrane protein HdeD (DUF308 family)
VASPVAGYSRYRSRRRHFTLARHHRDRAVFVVIAAWALVGGVLQVAAAIGLMRSSPVNGSWRWVESVHRPRGAADTLPLPGALALVIWIGAYALVFGILLLGLGFRLRGLKSPRAHQPAHSVA